MSNSNRKFFRKIVLALIGIIPSVLTLFIGRQVGYNQGQISTRIDTLERLDGIQNIEADNVTVNYYSGTDDVSKYNEALDRIVAEGNNNIQSIVMLENEKAALQEQVDNLNGQIDNLNEQVDEINSAQSIRQTIESATSHWDSLEYVQALSILKMYTGNSTEILTLYKQYSSEYCAYILAQADSLMAERRYQDAVSTLTDARSLVADGKIIDEKIQEIRNKAPVKLSDLTLSASRHFESIVDRPATDTTGHIYQTGNLFLLSAYGNEYGYASFYLGKKYNQFSGTIAISNTTVNLIEIDGWIEIYTKNGDTYTRLYSTETLNRISEPIQLPELNVSDADFLEIRYYNNNYYYNFGYHSLQMLIYDGVLYSD